MTIQQCFEIVEHLEFGKFMEVEMPQSKEYSFLKWIHRATLVH